MKDRQGTTIKLGDVVAMAITLNNRRYLESFTLRTCKKKDGELVLDNSFSFVLLKDCKPEELQIINNGVDIDQLNMDFYKKYGEKASQHDRIYIKASDAQDFYEDVCNLVKCDLYCGTDKMELRKDIVLRRIEALMADKTATEEGRAQIEEAFEIIDTLDRLRNEFLKRF